MPEYNVVVACEYVVTVEAGSPEEAREAVESGEVSATSVGQCVNTDIMDVVLV